MDESVKLIRSLLNLHGGLLIHEINNEYMKDVGKPVPFNSFGFNTLEEFLKSTGQFTATRSAAGLKVTAKLTHQSAHIVKLCQEQNMSVSERKRRRKKTIARTNASLARPNVRSAATMSKSRPMVATLLLPSNRIIRPGNSIKRVPGMSNSNPRPALVQISSNRPSNASQQAQNIQNSHSTQNVKQIPTVAVKLPPTNVPPQPNGMVLTKNLTPMKNPEKSKLNFAEIVRPPQSTNGIVSTKKLAPMKKPEKPKLDLHARLAPKKINSESPPESSTSMVLSEPAKRHLTLDLHTNIESTTPMPSPSHTPTTTPPAKRVNLRARSAMKQAQSSESDESTPSPTVPSNRSTLFRLFENVRQERKSMESAPKSNARSVTFAIPTSEIIEQEHKPDLYSRFVPKQPEDEPTTPVSQTRPMSPSHTPFMTTPPIELQHAVSPTLNDKPKLNTRFITFKPPPVARSSDSNGNNEAKGNIYARLPAKQINYTSELDQMSKQLNAVSLMDVDQSADDCTDSQAKGIQANGVTPVKKLDLDVRLQKIAPKQLQMDWDELAWTRSVNRCGNDVRVTVNF
ncbi:mucin-2-like [Sitodiplosis mosellana]|uniref:mucin-2-like n=1 Tax=Sitodiplosis mosellana TaxID=263140 RepID=UPI0024438393|nr:mucin-2-like [Sitodiplosis mosellana]